MPRGRKRLRARNPKRQARAFVRAYGSEERVAFIKSLPCLVPGCWRGPIENAHVVKIDGGTGLKGKAEGNAPLCHFHHQDETHGLHTLGARTFERLHGISLAECAAETERAWQAYLAATEAA